METFKDIFSYIHSGATLDTHIPVLDLSKLSKLQLVVVEMDYLVASPIHKPLASVLGPSKHMVSFLCTPDLNASLLALSKCNIPHNNIAHFVSNGIYRHNCLVTGRSPGTTVRGILILDESVWANKLFDLISNGKVKGSRVVDKTTPINFFNQYSGNISRPSSHNISHVNVFTSSPKGPGTFIVRNLPRYDGAPGVFHIYTGITINSPYTPIINSKLTYDIINGKFLGFKGSHFDQLYEKSSETESVMNEVTTNLKTSYLPYKALTSEVAFCNSNGNFNFLHGIFYFKD